MQLIPSRIAANANYSSNVMHVCRHTDELNFGYAVMQININEFTLTTCMFGIIDLYVEGANNIASPLMLTLFLINKI